MTVAVKPSRYTVLIPIKGGRCLAYNTVSRAFSVWNGDDRRYWEELTRRGRMPYRTRYRCFVQGGYIVNADIDEVEHLRSVYDRARRNDSHLMITLAPTLSCNFACHYCFQGLDKPLTRMSPVVRDAAIAFILRSLKGKKSFHLTWYGGEPLMDQRTIWAVSDKVIEYCDRGGVKYTSMMITNGYGLTVPVAEKLKEARVQTVQITIDGDAEGHDSRRHLISGRGTFGRIVDNIKAVAERGLLKVSIRVNIDTHNEADAERLLGVLHSEGLGVRNGVSVYFAPVEGIAEAADTCGSCMGKTDYAEAEVRLMRVAFERGLMARPKPPRFLGVCTAVRANSYVIVPTGDLHKCWDTVMDPTRRVGSIVGDRRESDASAESAWNEWSPFDNSVCSECVLLASCAGACAFKFVHHDYASGEAAKLPCPSLKFNLSEQLFMRAKQAGVVEEGDWDPERSATVNGSGALTGERHSLVSVAAVHGRLREMGNEMATARRA